MANWLQNLIVLGLVAACLAVVGRQLFSTLFGRKGKLGSCCAKGCSSHDSSNSNGQNGKAPVERVVFLPVELLGRRK